MIPRDASCGVMQHGRKLSRVLWGHPMGQLFEIGGSNRSLPMEGLRGIAVFLVFLQHYSTQFLTYAQLSGVTLDIAQIWHRSGNYGVELFFVLSGFLIYGILLKRR